MKRLFVFFASALLLLTGCVKEANDASSGDEVSVSFSAALPELATKAVADDDGNAAKVNHWIMEVRDSDGDVFTRQEEDGDEGTLTHVFNVKLVKGETYNVLFWADTKGTYNTANLKDVKLIDTESAGYEANLDSRDAFSAVETGFSITTPTSKNITLKRPFGQLNVIFTDLKGLYETIGDADEYGKYEPVEFLAEAKLPTSFDVESQLAGDPVSTALNITAKVNYLDNYATHEAEATLFMDYFFASEGSKDIVDIDFSFKSKGNTISHQFTSIPFQRNYRTNIKGELMTSGATWNVNIDPAWEGSNEVKIIEANSVAAANNAFADGAKNVSIATVGDETTLYLPQIADEIFIDFPNPDKTVTIKYGPAPTKAANNPAVVNVSTNDISKFTVTGISNVVWLINNQASLAYALNNATSSQTVALASDINMSGEWAPICSYSGKFDGRNYTISNLKVSDYGDYYAGFISDMSGASIKNVTFKNATITNAASNSGARGGIIAGWSYACNIDNCHVIDASITGTQKVAGILGSMSVEGGVGLNSVTNCSVKNLTMSPNDPTDPIIYQAGAIIGYVQILNQNPDGILIENNKIENITINNPCGDVGNFAYYCGPFIGSIVRKQTIDGQKIILKNNTVSGTNTEVFKTMYSSPYFGWTSNPEQYDGAIAPILIDGEEWTPNYPVQIVGGAKFPTLAGALSAATAGQTIKITKAGEYPTPGGIKKAVTIEGLNEKDANDDYVVSFNLESAYGNNENLTFKHLTFNLKQAENPDRGFTHCVDLTYNECAFTGEYWGYDSGMSTFNNCLFHNATNYCIWTYGGNITLNDCVFYSDHGKFVNVYAAGNGVHTIYANNCVFNNTGDAKKAVFNLKGGVTHGSVVMTNCSVSGNFPNSSTVSGDAIFSDSGLYMFDDPEWSSDVYAKVDGVTYFPYYTISENGDYTTNSAAGLKNAIANYNALTTAGERTITIADGTYEVSDMVILQNVKDNKSLTVKAASSKGVTIKLNSDSKSKMIFLIDGCSNYSSSDYVKIDGIKFDLSNLANTVVSHPIYCTSQNNDPAASLIDGYQASRYAHNVKVVNCELKGYGQKTENISFMYAPQSAGANKVTIDNCKVEDAGYFINGYFTDVEINNAVVSNCKACANINTTGITIKNSEISTWHNYCVRTNGGPVVVEGNSFNMTWTAANGEASSNPTIIYLRGDSKPLTAAISNNTIEKASADMYDVYCKTAWTVNDSKKTAGSMFNL